MFDDLLTVIIMYIIIFLAIFLGIAYNSGVMVITGVFFALLFTFKD